MSNIILASARHDALASGQVESLPTILLSLLERRYLADFCPDDWTLASDGHPSSVVVRELLAIGRGGLHDSVSPMTAALSAWHEPGQAVVMIVHGSPDPVIGHRHRVYYGSRRLPGGPATDEYLQSQSGSLAAHFPGIDLAPPAELRGHLPLIGFLRSAPALAVITGIPSGIAGQSGPGLERLVRSIGAREYALVVIAEPLSFAASDTVLDACRRLQGDISSYTSRQISRTEGEVETKDRNTVAEAPTAADRLPAYLQRCAAYVGTVTGQPMLRALAYGASLVIEAQRPLPARPVERESRSENWSESTSYNLVDAIARSCEELLSRHSARIQAGRGWGWWRVAVYLAADSDATLQSAARAVRAVATGDMTGLDPLRLITFPGGELRDALLYGRVLSLRPIGEAPCHPLGPDYDALATCVTSGELAALVAPPRQEIPGIAVRDRGDFAVTAPQPSDDAFELGRIRDSAGDDHGAVMITARALNEHVLVTGTPGSGKTNTCMHLLVEAHRQFGVPFLVIEPAKAEYRRLRSLLGAKLKVYSIGGTDAVPLHLNPLAPVAGASLLGHIDLLKAVFNASFAMHPGMPQILEEALLEVYQDRGWDLHRGTNDYLDTSHDPTDAAALTPCLADLHDQIDVVMHRKGYSGEVRLNLSAALRSRLHGLSLGAKGRSLNIRRPTSDGDLFDHPVILELHQLRDDEEKSFVMAAVFMRLYQYCEVRQRQLPPDRRERLQHITLIEEAHRLLSASRGDGRMESSDAHGKAVGMFTDMLAELRALGEGFMIAEQIPTKLAPETLKNTNLKIIHRLTAHADRTAVGQSANLIDRQIGPLAGLSKGLAVVHGLSATPDDPVADAALVQIARVKDGLPLPERDSTDESQSLRELDWRHGGCRCCPSPCDFLHRTEPELARDPCPEWVRQFAQSALGGVLDRAWELWSRWRRVRADERRTTGDDYCWFVHTTRQWLTAALETRGLSDNGSVRIRPADRLVVERLASQFGRCARSWLGHSELDEAARLSFLELGTALKAGLYRDTAPQLSGCERCPARCKLLPWIAGIDRVRAGTVIQQALPRNPADAFGHPHAAETLWHKVASALPVLDAHAVPPLDMEPAEWKRAWQYCVMTTAHLPVESAGIRDGMLAAILSAPAAT